MTITAINGIHQGTEHSNNNPITQDQDLTLEQHPTEDFFSPLQIHTKLNSLVNESTILQWDTREPHNFQRFLDLFEINTNYSYISLDTIFETQPKRTLDILWNTTLNNQSSSPLLLHYHSSLCTVAQQFQQTHTKQPHVLLSHFNENWGAISTPIPNRTADWGKLEKHWENQGCTQADVFSYINDPYTLAIITVQHHAFDHPKVHSIPLGIRNKQPLLQAMHKPLQERSQLLMLNVADTDLRHHQIQTVLESFQSVNLTNTYGTYGNIQDYYEEIKRSKFVLCLSGMGWDTYRMWETFYLGAIPVVEQYHREDGWHRTMDGLPIVWVPSSFENRSEFHPEFLERQYEIIRAQFPHYRYEKLTKEYWKSFVESILSS